MNTNVYKTLKEMLRDRGYDCIESEDINSIIGKNSSTNDRLLVYFVFDIKVSVKKMKHIKEIVESDSNFVCLVVVYKASITSFAKQFISTDLNLYVQSFSEKELSFNITKHKLVPKHRRLSNDEKNDILKKYRTALKNYPLISHQDAVSRYYSFVPGELIEITRDSPTAGIYVTYRYVV
mgnify:CR=1 FL=1|jgi:DNA-directed RNA polymerase subunit H (RpoH/RPB5)